MTKKSYLLLIILVMTYTSVFAKADSIYVYKTYKDYEANTGDFYDKYDGYAQGMGSITLTFKNGTEKTKIACKDIWGFTYNGVIFRTDKRTQQFARLVSQGKICYYENGPAHITMLKNKTKKEEFSIGYFCYVSKSLKTELVPLPQTGVISDAKKLTSDFRKKYPQYEKLFEAINKKYDVAWVRKKVKEFEGPSDKDKEDETDE